MNRRRSVCLSVFLVLIGWGAVAVPASAQHFQRTPGSLTQLAVGRTEVWGLNASNQTFRFNPSTKQFVKIPQTLTQIAVGGGTLGQADEVWGINASGQIFRFNFHTQKFAPVVGVLAQIAAGGNGFWGVDQNGVVYRYLPQIGNFGAVAGSLPFAQIAVGTGGGVWGVNSSHQVFTWVRP